MFDDDAATRAFSEFRSEIQTALDKLDLSTVEVPGLCPAACSCDTCRAARKACAPYMEMMYKRQVLWGLSTWVDTESDLHSRWNEARQGRYDAGNLVARWKEYKKRKGVTP